MRAGLVYLTQAARAISKGKTDAKTHWPDRGSGAAARAGVAGRGRPADKVTLCHATNSATNPYVAIEISVGGLNGHKAPNGDFHVNAKTGLQDFLLGFWQEPVMCPG